MKKSNILRIATRTSALALAQTQWVKTQLEKRHPHLSCEIIGIKTEGDRRLETPLTLIGGKGLFVKELELALLRDEADIAVHSMKDIPMSLADGLCLLAICEREDSRDVLVSPFGDLQHLPVGGLIGTSSLRRHSQLKALRPDLHCENLRGNIHTRLNKLDSGAFAGIILAAAGLKRLDLQHRINHYFSPLQMIPAVGQGAIGIEACNHSPWEEIIHTLDHPTSRLCVEAERAVNNLLNGGCQRPIGVHAILHGYELYIHGMVGDKDGQVIIRETLAGPMEQSQILAETLARNLLVRGAAKLLEEP